MGSLTKSPSSVSPSWTVFGIGTCSSFPTAMHLTSKRQFGGLKREGRGRKNVAGMSGRNILICTDIRLERFTLNSGLEHPLHLCMKGKMWKNMPVMHCTFNHIFTHYRIVSTVEAPCSILSFHSPSAVGSLWSLAHINIIWLCPSSSQSLSNPIRSSN